MPATVGSDRVFRAPAKTRKRCPMCNRMVEVGDDVVIRMSVKETSWGFMPGGYIGVRTAQRTHLYHPACAEQSPELAGRVPPPNRSA